MDGEGGDSGALAARHLASAVNPPELIEEHERATGGKVRTRFPPEPNGYLHIGHAKSMHMNFCLAFEKLGISPERRETIFRYDDTNPEAESQEYIQSLREDVEWLGWKPVATTYSSDSFDKLHDFALQLIREGKAYVCHQSKEDIARCRDAIRARLTDPNSSENPESPWRNRSVEENLRLFDAMRRGKYPENGATLRLKMDLLSPNPNMWDCVAYRIKYVPHPHAGDAWCIYPTYDYTHCIIDSLEHIDYSICTLEFETRRESYYWLLEALNIYRPNVYEFARLNITNTVMSKRKLLKLVKEGKVHGWDDPRMPTLKGLRRRGYTADILNAFCNDIGVSRSEQTIQYAKLQHCARQILNERSTRAMAVLSPVKLVLTNLTEKRSVEAPNIPFKPEAGSHTVTLEPEIYIDASDFRFECDSSYYGLAPGKAASLKYGPVVRCEEVVKGEDGSPVELRCSVLEGAERPKGGLTWVPSSSAISAEVRLYDHLFLTEFPGDDWEQQLNPSSEKIVESAMVDPSLRAAAPGDAFQFERIGFFVVDKDSSEAKMVFNLTVNLRESGPEKPADASNRSRKEILERNVAAKEAKKNLPPQEMFRSQSDLYSKFDDDGVPTHDSKGEPLSKSAWKKLRKDWEKQKKLYEKSNEKSNGAS